MKDEYMYISAFVAIFVIIIALAFLLGCFIMTETMASPGDCVAYWSFYTICCVIGITWILAYALSDIKYETIYTLDIVEIDNTGFININGEAYNMSSHFGKNVKNGDQVRVSIPAVKYAGLLWDEAKYFKNFKLELIVNSNAEKVME